MLEKLEFTVTESFDRTQLLEEAIETILYGDIPLGSDHHRAGWAPCAKLSTTRSAISITKPSAIPDIAS